jgi:hypothetical protein
MIRPTVSTDSPTASTGRAGELHALPDPDRADGLGAPGHGLARGVDRGAGDLDGRHAERALVAVALDQQLDRPARTLADRADDLLPRRDGGAVDRQHAVAALEHAGRRRRHGLLAGHALSVDHLDADRHRGAGALTTGAVSSAVPNANTVPKTSSTAMMKCIVEPAASTTAFLPALCL